MGKRHWRIKCETQSSAVGHTVVLLLLIGPETVIAVPVTRIPRDTRAACNRVTAERCFVDEFYQRNFVPLSMDFAQLRRSNTLNAKGNELEWKL